MSLTVYKASAGSGKTFTLAVEYISLVARNPQDYNHILAVTFTNKATQEMKMRILEKLYGIAHCEVEAEPYLKQVQLKTGLQESIIRENASKALSLLTHHYNEFRIQTIDAFFQSVLRNLARELNLTANLRIDLNDDQVEEQAVDELINSLEEGNPVLHWIRDYIDKNIEDDQGWNVIGQIKDFGKNIFKDFYKEHQKELEECFKDEIFFNDFIRDLRDRKRNIEKTIVDKAQTILSTFRNNNVDDPSYFIKGLYSYLLKCSRGEIKNEPAGANTLKCIENAEKWPAGKCPITEKNIIISLAQEQLREKLEQLEDYRKSSWKEYQSCNLTLRHLSQLRLLHAISDAVDDINRNSNRFMLSNTQSLLSTLMKDSDTPFVFERMGAYLKHIMIDEFQDTSTIQWSNFKKLLDNCIAQEDSRNLIVGDVKQSIYRWRQGDWRLLNNIERSFQKEQIKILALGTNYRSEERIVQFNNAFFKYAVEQTVNELKNDEIIGLEQLAEAYKEIEQIPFKNDNQGYIQIELFPQTDYREAIIGKLTDGVQELLDAGYSQKSITILVRRKGDVQDIADSFIHTFGDKVSLVSDEAFRLDASLAVNVIISALRVLTHPDDKLEESKLVKLYQQQVLKTKKTSNELFIDDNDITRLLPEDYTSKFEELLRTPLVDLVEKLYSIFSLDRLKNQSAYICTFYDTLNEYLRDHSADIDDFIEEWKNVLSEKTIPSDEVNGIRLLTIHKSKGLEYDNVFIPFCDWELEKKTGNIVWCAGEDKEQPFSNLPLIPVDFSKNNMLGTVFENNYKDEHLQNTVDNMNLLYVAFTRARKNLFITGRRMGKSTLDKLKKEFTTSNRSQVIEQILPLLTEKLVGSELEYPDNCNDPIKFTWGKIPLVSTKKDIQPSFQKTNPFSATEKKMHVAIETFPNSVVSFRQSNKSNDFINGEDNDPSDTSRYIKMGNILHQLFSTILTEADIEPRLKELEQEGIIYNDEVTSRELRQRIHNAFKNETVRKWFSPDWKVFNERTIIEFDKASGEIRERRPDRVMTNGKEFIVIDFKFGKPREEYKEQVIEYIQILKTMGYKNIKGYLWYVIWNKIETCIV